MSLGFFSLISLESSLTFRFMVTIMSVCFMSLWLIITHFHCPITSLVTSIINRNGQLYLQLAILVLFVSMFLQTPATVHFFFIINAFFYTMPLSFRHENLLYFFCCSLQSGNRKEVSRMAEILINFIMAVAAQVLAYYLCKWLDNHRKGR